MENKKDNRGGARKGAGRPKGKTKEKIKDIRLTIRLSDEEKDILEECSEILKCNRTKVIVRGLMDLYEKIKK